MPRINTIVAKLICNFGLIKSTAPEPAFDIFSRLCSNILWECIFFVIVIFYSLLDLLLCYHLQVKLCDCTLLLQSDPLTCYSCIISSLLPSPSALLLPYLKGGFRLELGCQRISQEEECVAPLAVSAS